MINFWKIFYIYKDNIMKMMKIFKSILRLRWFFSYKVDDDDDDKKKISAHFGNMLQSKKNEVPRL